MRLAKQTADQIQDVYFKSKAYCAIATAQVKTDANQTLRLAKQTADQMQSVALKLIRYCDIATEQAKINPKDAKQTADHSIQW